MMLDDATRIMNEFRKFSDKPVKAIIFTHSHGDHTGGAAAFFGTERPQIWAHKNFGSCLAKSKPYLLSGGFRHRVDPPNGIDGYRPDATPHGGTDLIRYPTVNNPLYFIVRLMREPCVPTGNIRQVKEAV